MRMATVIPGLSATVLVLVTSTLSAAPPVTIHNPWLVNDRVADTRNIATMGATYVNAYTPDGVIPPADNEAKAINIYNNQKRRLYHWADEPPQVGGNAISDPTYTQNVFGWCLCGRHADQACTIVNAAGLTPMKVGLPGHWVYQVQYDGAYHFYDTMTTCYVYNKANPRKVASCAEIKADATILGNAVADGRACPGFLLCGDTVSWFQDVMNSWSNSGTSVQTTRWNGNMDLRSGQIYKRTWEAWQNEHPPAVSDPDKNGIPDPPYHHESQHDWKDHVNYPYWEPYGQVISYIHSSKTTYRRWANGTDTLAPDFRSAACQALLEPTSHDIATYYQDSITPDLHSSAVNVQGEAIFKISVPYYLTNASFSGEFVRATSSDICKVFFSSNGTTWTQVYDAPVGTTQVTNQSLRANVFGLWQTWYIKVQMKGVAAQANAGVSNFTVVTTFEHNKGAMPYLDKGVNNITLTMDNPGDLGSDSKVKVTYKWKENHGSGWTIDKTFVKYVSTSPATFTIVTGGTKVPRTEYIQMEIVPTPEPDATPPAAITDLGLSGTPGRTSITLRWTAPGDDGNVGFASGYDVRYSTSPIDAGNFDSAPQASAVPVPQSAGGAETFTVTGLNQGTTYYFAIKAFDEDGNMAPISNTVSASTKTPDTEPPNAVSNLAATATTTLGQFTITWTAPADNGNGYVAAYDLRWSTQPITDATFTLATAITGLGAPKSPGGAESFTADGLPTGVTIYFAIRSADDIGNWSPISNVPTAKKMLGTLTFQNGLNGYNGCQDTYMSAAAVTTKYEGSTELQVAGMGGGTNRRRAIVKFDISSLPKTANITKATLCLYASSNENHDAAGGKYAVHRVTTPWSATAVSWNMPWVVSGGSDMEGTPDALSDKQTTSGVWYEWDVTARVQNFIANPGSNNGWTIKAHNEGQLNRDWFYACEYTGNITLRPKLVISDDPLIVDTTRPEAVSDLHVTSALDTSLTLAWTAPADYADAGEGPFTCASYNLRYSTNPITNDASFNAATPLSLPAPAAPGTAQTRVVTGLMPRTTYYFAIKSIDANGNVSALSNILEFQTPEADDVAPAWIGNVMARPSGTGGGVDLTWTAPADYGHGGIGPFICAGYDIRYSTSPITEANWASATQVTGEPNPQAPGSAESFTISGLTGGTRYYFAIKAVDPSSNVSEISNVATAVASILGEMVLQNGLNGYNGVVDSFLFQSGPTSNYGGMGRMAVGGPGTSGMQRGIIRFDLSTVPAGMPVATATLYLYSYNEAGVLGSEGFYGAYPVTRDWVYNQTTWMVAKTGVSWALAGGEFAESPDGTSPKQASAAVWYPFDVTARVREWLIGGSSNYGWIIKPTDESLSCQDHFYQSEITDAALRPKLVLSDVVPPVPGDISGDGAVDVEDLLYFVDSFGAVCGSDRNYDPRCDFNSDQVVDVVDLLTFVQDYWPE